jgi:hypothetical protein
MQLPASELSRVLCCLCMFNTCGWLSLHWTLENHVNYEVWVPRSFTCLLEFKLTLCSCSQISVLFRRRFCALRRNCVHNSIFITEGVPTGVCLLVSASLGFPPLICVVHSSTFRRHAVSYRVFHLKRNPNYNTYRPTASPTKRRNEWILAAVSRCCSWCTAWNLYGRNFSCLVTNQCIVVLFGTFLLGCALLNASRTAANDFDAK